MSRDLHQDAIKRLCVESIEQWAMRGTQDKPYISLQGKPPRTFPRGELLNENGVRSFDAIRVLQWIKKHEQQ